MLTSLKRSVVLSGLLLGSFTLGTMVNPVAHGAESDGFATFLQVYDLIKSEYVERNIDEVKLRQGAIRGMLESLGDPYTRYMDPKSFGSMQEERQGSFSGIGIQIGIRDKKLTVIAPIEDTPAWKAGLKPGDWIMEIDGKSTRDMSDSEASSLIRGRLGSSVRLLIGREGESKPFEVKIVRATIETRAVPRPRVFNGIGYVRLITFMKTEAPGELRKALEEIKGYKALVLDLRSNPGGLLQNAVEITSMFVPQGTVVRIVSRDGESQNLTVTGRTVVPAAVPMVVLIDGGSASASEIVSGALQDLHRATLMGTKSFGKGLVQTVHALADGSGVAITTNKYLTANGHDINKRGIVPDVVVEPPAAEEDKDTKASPSPAPRLPLDDEARFKADVQLQAALTYLQSQLATGGTPLTQK